MLKYIILVVVVGLALFLLLSAAAAVWAFFYGKRYAYRFLKPNPRDVQNELERLRRKYPNSSVDEVASKYVGDQALLLGIVGLTTEIWGCLFPVLGFTIDASFTTLRQMRMAHVITALYGGDDKTDPEEMEMRYMAMVGLGSLAPRLVLKFIGGEIPVLGGVINFGMNWVVTRSIGGAAITWGRGKTIREVASDTWANRASVVEAASEKIRQAKRATLQAKESVQQAVRPEPTKTLLASANPANGTNTGRV
jgi:uncharacterized protein (DUF697 family)